MVLNRIESKIDRILMMLKERKSREKTKTLNFFYQIKYALASNKQVVIRTSGDYYSHDGKDHKITELTFDCTCDFIRFEEEVVYREKPFTRSVILYPEHIVSIEIAEESDNE